MFALKSHRLGKTHKGRSEVERMTEVNPDEEIDDTVKTRFQEIGPQFTIKMRWIRRGPLGETGDEREKREKQEAESGEAAQEFGEEPTTRGDDDEELAGGDNDDDDFEGEDLNEEDELEAEEQAKREIGLDQSDSRGQPNFPPVPPSTTTSSSAQPTTTTTTTTSTTTEGEDQPPNPKKRKRRTKPSHPLYRPSPSPSVSPEPEAVPLPTVGKKKNPELASALSTVGKTWHAGRGEGGVREGAKRREWNWDAKMQVSRRKFFL
jgi:ribosome production factor 1